MYFMACARSDLGFPIIRVEVFIDAARARLRAVAASCDATRASRANLL